MFHYGSTQLIEGRFGYTFLDPRVGMVTRPVGIDEFQADEKDILDSPLVNQPGSRWEYGVCLSSCPRFCS